MMKCLLLPTFTRAALLAALCASPAMAQDVAPDNNATPDAAAPDTAGQAEGEAWLDALMESYDDELTQQGLMPEPTIPPPPWMDDPLGHLSGLMDNVLTELNHAETGDPTQTEQRKIIEDMDYLIALLEQAKNQQGSGGGGGGNGNSMMQSPAAGLGAGPGLNDSVLRDGSGRGQEGLADRDNAMDMPDLDEADRLRLLQGGLDALPPGYASLYEEYQYRLSRTGGAEASDD